MSTTLTPTAKTLQVTPVEFHEMPADRRVRFTVEQYEQLMRAGFLIEGSPIELLDGQLVWKDRRDHRSPGMPIGKWHVKIVKRLYAWLTKICEGHGCYPMSQQPVTLTPTNEPEPDASVILGDSDDDYPRHPEPTDILLVIEVADTSLSYDLGEKLQLYASVEIPMYWVINLADETLDVFEEPDTKSRVYHRQTVFHKGESVSLTLADGTVVSTPVDSLLP
jgi:Uma2 family endonuclease